MRFERDKDVVVILNQEELLNAVHEYLTKRGIAPKAGSQAQIEVKVDRQGQYSFRVVAELDVALMGAAPYR